MIDYRDFMHQADADIKRANKLFIDEDFGLPRSCFMMANNGKGGL